MNLQVKLFGIAREIASENQIQIELKKENPKVSDLLETLKNKYPELQKLRSLLIAVNSDYAEEETVLSSQDEIAVIPPVSGG